MRILRMFVHCLRGFLGMVRATYIDVTIRILEGYAASFGVAVLQPGLDAIHAF